MLRGGGAEEVERLVGKYEKKRDVIVLSSLIEFFNALFSDPLGASILNSYRSHYTIHSTCSSFISKLN
jgi:hypothetical protein